MRRCGSGIGLELVYKVRGVLGIFRYVSSHDTGTTRGTHHIPRFLYFILDDNEATPRERSDRGHFLSLGKKASSYRGAYRVQLFNESV